MVEEMQSVEFRCELRDPELAGLMLPAIGAIFVGEADWEDTYFRVPEGWLKRRSAKDEPTDWVRYRRAERITPKIVGFDVLSDDQGREQFGTLAMPTWIAIRKRRACWLLGNLNVYLDHVESLGHFCKLETLVTPSQNLARGHRVIHHVRAKLEPALGEPISRGYAQLVASGFAA